MAVHEELITTDPDEMAELYSSIFESKLRLSAVRTGAEFRHSRYDAGSFWLKRLTAPSTMHVRAQPLDPVFVVAPSSGLYRLSRASGAEEVFGPGDLCLVPPGVALRLSTHDIDFQTVALDPSLFADPAMGNRPPESTDWRPVSAGAAQMFLSTLDYVRSVVFAHPEIASAPLALAGAGRLLAAITTETFGRAAGDRAPLREHEAHPAALRRAVAFIEANPHTDIGIAEIAAAARVTPRAVQLAFARHLSTSPLTYLRRVRLDRVHQDLLAADPTCGDTVAAVAARWGFAHLGRFAAAYRAAYGHPPNQTLRG